MARCINGQIVIEYIFKLSIQKQIRERNINTCSDATPLFKGGAN